MEAEELEAIKKFKCWGRSEKAGNYPVFEKVIYSTNHNLAYREFRIEINQKKLPVRYWVQVQEIK